MTSTAATPVTQVASTAVAPAGDSAGVPLSDAVQSRGELAIPKFTIVSEALGSAQINFECGNNKGEISASAIPVKDRDFTTQGFFVALKNFAAEQIALGLAGSPDAIAVPAKIVTSKFDIIFKGPDDVQLKKIDVTGGRPDLKALVEFLTDYALTHSGKPVTLAPPPARVDPLSGKPLDAPTPTHTASLAFSPTPVAPSAPAAVAQASFVNPAPLNELEGLKIGEQFISGSGTVRTIVGFTDRQEVVFDRKPVDQPVEREEPRSLADVREMISSQTIAKMS